jgi:hypothetical protein
MDAAPARTDAPLLGGPGAPPDPGAAGVEGLATWVNDLVPLANNIGNDVLVDNARPVRWAGPAFAVCALALLPWIVVIAMTLPSRELSPNYDIAWAGFDSLLFSALACTAGGTLRRSRYLGMAASWSAALLVVDAWFDVMTAPSGANRLEAVLMAVLVELPLAGICGWLTVHTQDIADRRVALLIGYGRSARPPAQVSPKSPATKPAEGHRGEPGGGSVRGSSP